MLMMYMCFSQKYKGLVVDPNLRLQRTIRKQANKYCLAWYCGQKVALRSGPQEWKNI